MFGIESAYLDAMLEAVQESNFSLQDTTVEDATEPSYVPLKGDTLGLDQQPENATKETIGRFDQFASLITEERGEYANPLAETGLLAGYGARTFFGCDPCDRSNQLKEFLQTLGRDEQYVADVLRQDKVIEKWEEWYGQPASITGANAAITCVRRGQPIGSVLLNFITQELTVSCSAGIYQLDLPKKPSPVDLQYVREYGNHMFFPTCEYQDSMRLVTFIGKPERGYPDNFFGTQMVAQHDLEKHLHYQQPGGPTRILYLSKIQSEQIPIGFIMANGEKIGEWLHWLPFIRFAISQEDWSERPLKIFEVVQDQSFMRDGYLMTPSPIYSIFNVTESLTVLDVDRLRRLDNPSKYRATLIVVPASNKWVIRRVEQLGYRELFF